MKKTLIILSFAIALFSCTNGSQRKQGVYYNPEQGNAVLVQEDRSRSKYESNEFLEAFEDSKVTLTIMSPAIEGDISYESSKQLTLKLLRLVTSNGIGCLGGDPTYALVPVLTLQNKGVTATVPSKMTITYTMHLYVGNALTGEIYETTAINIMGVGNSYEKAVINAVNSIGDNREIKQMLANASNKIINNYEKDPYAIINKANEYISKDDIDFAYLLLSSVPDAATETYALVQEYLPKVQEMFYLRHSENMLSRMKDAIAKAGITYNPDISAYHQLIPVGSDQRLMADKLFDEYIAKLDEHERLKIEQEIYMEREEMACQKLEMELSIQANQELMNTYKELAESRAQTMYNVSTSSSDTYLASEDSYNESGMGFLSSAIYGFGDMLNSVEQMRISDLLGWVLL
ncbi:MAG: hypothetical protein IJC77_01155 [Bacteroidaceae bacterium]|nr:hypothetical protein [Bacteroidaceae bacterium]